MGCGLCGVGCRMWPTLWVWHAVCDYKKDTWDVTWDMTFVMCGFKIMTLRCGMNDDLQAVASRV